ncbi:ion transporter [Enteractinococcus coprophilus]|uniref:Voltage-gated potassium channel n=1 Tax=Enteractinococcus coprophilus TaxID=1027633 RepID=A0A543AGH2_9MICC|nr:ion transporter [Enteractinococcus coprophilus]TQL71657.1 voltage-gated potassium channel [Enteractinococcus coprophilus]
MAEDEQRLDAAESLARRLDRPMGLLGIIFLLVVLAQLLVTDPTGQVVLSIINWVFWGIFVAEFLLRAYIARFQARFWRKNWWQIIFLALPFLRFFRALRALRILRVTRFGRVLSAGVRGTRSAEKLLSNRVAWLLAVTAIVILAASQLLYLFADYSSYLDALYEAAIATITGSGFSADTIFVRMLHVVLATFSVVVFATLAGTLGAYFLRREPEPEETSVADEAPASKQL